MGTFLILLNNNIIQKDNVHMHNNNLKSEDQTYSIVVRGSTVDTSSTYGHFISSAQDNTIL